MSVNTHGSGRLRTGVPVASLAARLPQKGQDRETDRASHLAAMRRAVHPSKPKAIRPHRWERAAGRSRSRAVRVQQDMEHSTSHTGVLKDC